MSCVHFAEYGSQSEELIDDLEGLSRQDSRSGSCWSPKQARSHGRVRPAAASFMPDLPVGCSAHHSCHSTCTITFLQRIRIHLSSDISCSVPCRFVHDAMDVESVESRFSDMSLSPLEATGTMRTLMASSAGLHTRAGSHSMLHSPYSTAGSKER